MLPYLALIFAAPRIFMAGVFYGRRLAQAEGLTPEEAAAQLAAALTPISPEEAVRRGGDA